MNKKLLALYGLKWNPFSPELPTEALYVTPKIEHFCWRIEQHLLREGGFAMITGDPGTGKSVVLRLLAERLAQLPDISVAAIAHPSSNLADFYREMGDLFGLELKPHNRWGGFKALRERWLAHLEGTLLRPVLLIDEAQEMPPSVLSELRLLSSALRLPDPALGGARRRYPPQRQAAPRGTAAARLSHPRPADHGIRRPRGADGLSDASPAQRRQPHADDPGADEDAV